MKTEKGQGLIEYVLVLVLVAVLIFALVSILEPKITTPDTIPGIVVGISNHNEIHYSQVKVQVNNLWIYTLKVPKDEAVQYIRYQQEYTFYCNLGDTKHCSTRR